MKSPTKISLPSNLPPVATLAPTNRRRRLPAVFCLFLCACLSACSLVKLKDESKAYYSSTVLAGRVSSAGEWNGPVVVAAYAKRNGKLEFVHHTVLHEPGGYELMVPKGEYSVLAFGDANGNLMLDAGEPVGRYDARPIVASGTGALVDLDFMISDLAQADIPVGTAVAKPPSGKLHSTQVGAIADLDDRIFSDEFGRNGYWAPMEFFKEAGGNIYFLEKYDPTKIPILFVHGVAGSPQNWKYFFEHIDRTRYQPWFFYYPSGSSVESTSYLLFWKLLNLQRRYHFDKIYFTAHSMGGLVVRSFLANQGAYFPAAKVFVSLSTPWGGDDMAELGVQYSPAVIPAWNDMQPGGRFMQSLFQKPLPPGLDYYLFFGHRGGYSLMRSANDDGAITLTSQLRPSAQAEARMVYGFNEDHTSILFSPKVFAQYVAVLNAIEKKTDDGAQPGSGNLRLSFSYEQREGMHKSDPLLVLTPIDAGREKIVLPISARDSGRELGPFPPGAYEASLLSYAFKTTPGKIPLTITAGDIPDLKFSMAAQGVLAGYIGADVKPTDNPAGSYRAPRRDIAIESITLSDGKDIRSLKPNREPKDRTIEAYLAGEDYAFQSSFSFVGLAEGKYELTINAAGYRTYKQRFDVVPGQYGYSKPIDLTRLEN